MPPALARCPRLLPECRSTLKAFGHLSASRDSNGYGANPIRVGEVASYAALQGLGREEALKLLRLVQTMDEAFLKHLAEREKNTVKPNV
jgi:hypothetical protein